MFLNLKNEQILIIKESFDLIRNFYISNLKPVEDILRNISIYKNISSKEINIIKDILYKETLLKNKDKIKNLDIVFNKIVSFKELEREDFFLILDSVELLLKLNLGQVNHILVVHHLFSTSSDYCIDLSSLNNSLIALKKEYIPNLNYYESFSVFDDCLSEKVLNYYKFLNYLKIKKDFFKK